MSCGDCDLIVPVSCAPFASLASMEQMASRVDACCKANLPLGTNPTLFLTLGFPNGISCHCKKLWVNAGGVWYLSLDGGMTWCELCVSYPSFHGAQIGFAIDLDGEPVVAINGLGYVEIPFDVVNYDTDGFYIGIPGRLYAPFDGYYDVDGVWTVADVPANDTGSAKAQITVDGIGTPDSEITNVFGGTYDPGHTATVIYAHALRKTIYLNAGQYVAMQNIYGSDTEDDGEWAQGHSQNWLGMIFRGI